MSFSLPELFSVQGLSVLVTGGGSGLGLHIAKAFATNGARVLITGRRQEKLDEAVSEIEPLCNANGGTIHAISADLTDHLSFPKIIVALGDSPSLDVLINCAGIVKPDQPSNHRMPILELQAAMMSSEHATWSSTFLTNVEAPYFLSVSLIHLLAASQVGGRIINISSIGARMSDPMVHQPAYQVSKAALDHLTRLLASKFREYQVRVNAIAPGYFASAMNDPNNPNSTISRAKELVPLKRGGEGADIAGTAIWLASPAGAYVDGQVIVLDGGRSWA